MYILFDVSILENILQSSIGNHYNKLSECLHVYYVFLVHKRHPILTNECNIKQTRDERSFVLNLFEFHM